jgi:uncharacterized membrane protein
MIPDPLHPAVVHFPIVLAILAPFFAVGAIWAIRRNVHPRKAWGLATAMLAALSLSSWVSLETGEDQEERVEDAVAAQPFHAHEEAAQAFLLMSGGVLAIALVGFAGGSIGRAARLAGAAGTLVLVGAAVRTGHTGGQLAYKYGAAGVYAQNAGASARPDGTPVGARATTGAESRERRRDADDRE